jgi:hypothetical protein
MANSLAYSKSFKEEIAKAKKEGRTIVATHKEFSRVRHALTAPKGQPYSIMSLVEYEGCFHPMAVSMPVGLETEYIEPFIRTENTHVNEYFLNEVERFSRTHINVSVENVEMMNLLLQDNRIYVIVRKGKNGKTVSENFYVSSGNGTYIDIVKGEEVQIPIGVMAEVYIYETIGVSSPGQLKSKEITLYCTNLPGFDPVEHLDNMTHGMFKMLLQYYRGKSFKGLKELAQISTRISQFKAPMVKTKPIKGMAITFAKLKDERGNEWADGYYEIAAEGAAECLSDERFLVLPSAIDGDGAQARPFIVNKGLGHITIRKAIIEKMRALKLTVDGLSVKNRFIFRAQDELTEEDILNYEEAVIEKKGSWYGKTLILIPSFHREDGSTVSNKDVFQMVDIWVDLNVHKTVCDLRRPFSGLNIMGMAHEKVSVEDEANTSNQLLATALFADFFRAQEYMKKCAKEEAARITTNALTGEARRLGVRELQADLALASQAINPEFARTQWAPYFQDNLNKALEGFGNRLAKLSVKTDGIYLKIMPDFSHMFGINLLRYDDQTGECEVLAPQMNREMRRRGIGIKYPKMAFDEFAKLIFVTADELIDRAYGYLCNGFITELQYEIICHEITHLHDGIVMVPAIEGLKNMLAGMDFDGDAMVIYCDEEFVKIIWSVRPVATIILREDEYLEYQKNLRDIKEEETCEFIAAK